MKKKINGCFSGGQDTRELQELHGANIQVAQNKKGVLRNVKRIELEGLFFLSPFVLFF